MPFSARAYIPEVERQVEDQGVREPPPSLEGQGAFSWAAARALLAGLPNDRGLNIAHEAVERHASGPAAENVAIRWLGARGEKEAITYSDLAALSRRFANVLEGLEIGPGDAVFVLMGRIPELYVAALGTLRHRSVFCPLPSASAPESIEYRLRIGHARVLVTTEELYARKVRWIRDRIPGLEHVIVVGEGREESDVPHCLDWRGLIDDTEPRHVIPPTDLEDPALLHFTGGALGTTDAAVHVHEAVVMHHFMGGLALDLHPGDIYWCTADPGSVCGTTCGIIAPLTNGATLVVDEAEVDLTRWYDILETEKVQVWCTSPTAISALKQAGAEPIRSHDLSALRFVASVGERLDRGAIVWSERAFGKPLHEGWCQVETGGIMIASYGAMDVKPGSMGRPLPGIEAGIVRRDDEGRIEELREPGVEGELAFRSGWPSMMRAYLDAPERYAQRFADGWYLSGELAKRDAEGWFWFVG